MWAQARSIRTAITILRSVPLKGLEIEGHVTEVLGVPALLEGYGNTKDKALDLKYQVLTEGKWWPAVAIGIMDPQGTRVYPAQYLVASKQIYPFDFTVGFGNGRYGKETLPGQGEGFAAEMFTDNASWRKDGQFFWGVQFALSEEIMLMAEYNPIRYQDQTSDPAQGKYFTEAVPSKFNFGLRWRPLGWLETDLSWQRGNQVGVNLSVAFDLGKHLIPLYDHPYKEKPEYRLSPAEERIARGLEASGFGSVVVRKEGEELRIEAQNVKYYYTPRALGVMLRLAAEMAPAEVRTIRLVVTENGIPMAALRAAREDAVLFATEKLTAKEFLSLAQMDTEVSEGLPVKKKLDRLLGLRPEPLLPDISQRPLRLLQVPLRRAGVGELLSVDGGVPRDGSGGVSFQHGFHLQRPV